MTMTRDEFMEQSAAVRAARLNKLYEEINRTMAAAAKLGQTSFSVSLGGYNPTQEELEAIRSHYPTWTIDWSDEHNDIYLVFS